MGAEAVKECSSTSGPAGCSNLKRSCVSQTVRVLGPSVGECAAPIPHMQSRRPDLLGPRAQQATQQAMQRTRSKQHSKQCGPCSSPHPSCAAWLKGAPQEAQAPQTFGFVEQRRAGLGRTNALGALLSKGPFSCTTTTRASTSLSWPPASTAACCLRASPSPHPICACHSLAP